MVEHHNTVQEVAGTNPGGNDTQGLLITEQKEQHAFLITSATWLDLDFQVFLNEDYKLEAPSHDPRLQNSDGC